MSSIFLVARVGLKGLKFEKAFRGLSLNLIKFSNILFLEFDQFWESPLKAKLQKNKIDENFNY